MSTLQNKIDFVAFISVTNANPNGDPLNGNNPRTDYSGFGEISDVCIKRKIRNRMQDMGASVFVQSSDRADDGCPSLAARAEMKLGKPTKKTDPDEYAKQACLEWLDVRSFGQVFAMKGKDKDASVSIGVRGPVSIHQSVSVAPVEIEDMQITKSVNGEGEDRQKRSSDTMGMKHFVRHGLYKMKGSINVQLAEKTGFSEEDAEVIKEALRTLFANDASSARPDGSMEVLKVYWFRHNSKLGQYSSARVHRSVEARLLDPEHLPKSADDYEILVVPLEDLVPEILDGV